MYKRIKRESKTIKQMIELYCRENHFSSALCTQCSDLLECALERLEKCPFQEGKTTCAQCPVHCYVPDKRERIRAVMRYSGPRMLWGHPLSAIQHLFDRGRKEPV